MATPCCFSYKVLTTCSLCPNSMVFCVQRQTVCHQLVTTHYCLQSATCDTQYADEVCASVSGYLYLFSCMCVCARVCVLIYVYIQNIALLCCLARQIRTCHIMHRVANVRLAIVSIEDLMPLTP